MLMISLFFSLSVIGSFVTGVIELESGIALSPYRFTVFILLFFVCSWPIPPLHRSLGKIPDDSC